tara:strand:- start:32 stop:271 length:240 start_codon:yes stop_codon:yes gene_type:complete
MDTPQLNFDMISKILQHRMEAKKEERIMRENRKKFSEVVKIMNSLFAGAVSIYPDGTDPLKNTFELIDNWLSVNPRMTR